MADGSGRMPTMDSVTAYRDTRGIDTGRPAFTDVVVKGIAPGGGLFVPDRLPTAALVENT